MTAQLAIIDEFWRHRGWKIDVQPTKAAGHAAILAHEAAKARHQLVFAAGGDGTIGEVANGLAKTDTILAPLPMGTTNSFAKELKMPMPKLFEKHRLYDVIEALANGSVYSVDLGYNRNVAENGRYWLMWSGLGADSFLIHALEPRPAWSRRLGRVGYSIQGLSILPAFEGIQATITVDDQKVEGEFVLIEITNCRFYAGMLPMNPTAKLDDGLYEVFLFKGKRWPRTLNYIVTLLQNRQLPKSDVIALKGRTVTVETARPIGCHTDGDQAGFAPLVSELCPQALRLLVPKSAPPDLFLADGEAFT